MALWRIGDTVNVYSFGRTYEATILEVNPPVTFNSHPEETYYSVKSEHLEIVSGLWYESDLLKVNLVPQRI